MSPLPKHLPGMKYGSRIDHSSAGRYTALVVLEGVGFNGLKGQSMSSSLVRFAAIALMSIAAVGCTSQNSGENIIWGSPQAQMSSMVETTAYASTSADIGGPVANLPKPYFIDFRSRSAESYGHSFVVYGKLDANGHIPYDRKGVLIHSMTEVAGLHPASTSNIPYSLGHFVPVPSETGASDGDTEIQYMTANYRIDLTPEQYADIVGYIKGLQASSPVWHAVAYNCSAFIGDIAKHMGMKTPNPLLFPENYIHSLEKMNS